jgi:hypothetical protein
MYHMLCLLLCLQYAFASVLIGATQYSFTIYPYNVFRLDRNSPIESQIEPNQRKDLGNPATPFWHSGIVLTLV